MAVAREEFLDSKRRRRVNRANQHDVADTLCGQLDPAINVGAHHDLADLGVGLHEAQQLLTRELDDLAGFADASARERAAAQNQIDFTGELSGTMNDDEGIAEA